MYVAFIERANSFVGTAEYVSPELLQSKVAYKRLVWAYVCVCRSRTIKISHCTHNICVCYHAHTRTHACTHKHTPVYTALTYILPATVLTSGHWVVSCISCCQEDLLSMLRKFPFNIILFKLHGHLSTSNEYLCFQKITKLEYMFPDGFPENAKNLISKILVSVKTVGWCI